MVGLVRHPQGTASSTSTSRSTARGTTRQPPGALRGRPTIGGRTSSPFPQIRFFSYCFVVPVGLLAGTFFNADFANFNAYRAKRHLTFRGFYANCTDYFFNRKESEGNKGLVLTQMTRILSKLRKFFVGILFGGNENDVLSMFVFYSAGTNFERQRRDSFQPRAEALGSK